MSRTPVHPRLEGHPDTALAVAPAKSVCGDVAVHAARECVRLNGGIGFTWEHPAHMLLKRAKSGTLASCRSDYDV